MPMLAGVDYKLILVAFVRADPRISGVQHHLLRTLLLPCFPKTLRALFPVD